MLDQTSHPSFVDQEERRRVFWSVYLLDRFVSCGRDKPHAILDSSVHLQLPCSDSAWEHGKPEKTLTLEELGNRSSTKLNSLGPFGQVVAMASILGRSSQYSLQDFNIHSRHSPWDPSSDFAAIEFDLLHLESHMGLQKPIQELIPSGSSPGASIDQSKTIPAIFARVLFHLCYCLLNHPFLLRRRIASGQAAAPSSFLSRAFHTGLHHAQQMIEMLSTARNAGCAFNASFGNYCIMVASSVLAIHRLQGNLETQSNADRLIQEALGFLESSAKNWPNVSNMVGTLISFIALASRQQYAFYWYFALLMMS
jgi:Fungal specific transcription factor domain